MNEYYSFSIPNVSNYEAKYYFSKSLKEYNPKIFPPHVHDRLEIYILIEGDVSFVVESTLYKVSSGDAIISKPNEMHNCILDSTSLHNHICFWFDCTNEFLFNDFLTHDFGKGNLISPNEDNKKRLNEIYAQLKDAQDKNDKHKVMYLTLEMLDIFRKSISDDTSLIQMPKVLKDILSDLDANFKTIKDLSYFTDKYFVSNSTLNRLFNTYLHTTPKLYIETKRLAYSRRLLKQGASVLYACMESGFPDYSNYIRLFRKRFSITPKQYRNGLDLK